jgi:thymidylate synthase (FAD)
VKVELVAITVGAGKLIEHNAQEVIGYITRVSNPSNQMNFDTVDKLLAYCIRNNHWSPFEHASFTVEIVTSRAIGAQILRHRSFKFQEFSQRYAAAATVEKYPARSQDLKNRQNSKDDMSDQDKAWFDDAQQEVWERAYGKYKEALDKGVAKEQARFLLPLATTTVMYMTGDVRCWIHYIELRSAHGTQKEHQDIAIECKRVFTEQFPDVAKALNWV